MLNHLKKYISKYLSKDLPKYILKYFSKHLLIYISKCIFAIPSCTQIPTPQPPYQASAWSYRYVSVADGKHLFGEIGYL